MIDPRIEDLIEKHIEGRIAAPELAELNAYRAADPNVDCFIAAERELRDLVSGAPKPSFAPRFEARVMGRIRETLPKSVQAHRQRSPEPDFASALARLFPRVGGPAFTLSAFAMASNASAASRGSTLAERLFALPTLDAVSLLVF